MSRLIVNRQNIKVFLSISENQFTWEPKLNIDQNDQDYHKIQISFINFEYLFEQNIINKKVQMQLLQRE